MGGTIFIQTMILFQKFETYWHAPLAENPMTTPPSTSLGMSVEPRSSQSEKLESSATRFASSYWCDLRQRLSTIYAKLELYYGLCRAKDGVWRISASCLAHARHSVNSCYCIIKILESRVCGWTGIDGWMGAVMVKQHGEKCKELEPVSSSWFTP